MRNVVYTTTMTKPAPEVALRNALADLTVFIPRKEVTAQVFAQSAPSSDDEGRALAFRLTDDGMQLFRDGFPGHPGFKEWPEGGPSLDFDQYPLDD